MYLYKLIFVERTGLISCRKNCWLINVVYFYAENGLGGKLGKIAYLEKWISTITSLTAGETTFNVTFEWDESETVPGAFIIKNHHHSQFYLKTVTLDIPGHGPLHFVCNSWVYPAHRYKYNRVFFSNKVRSYTYHV